MVISFSRAVKRLELKQCGSKVVLDIDRCDKR